ncbi:MAG TPA: fibrillarin-like rRNA/tRNA 2'-O-methyltransferase [Methanomassiliicoccales archaeon]|nr:fibrillarin-like rRNA/tRNA 2'-O-methyltransferase [Methanomassiliicoccales archaeon]
MGEAKQRIVPTGFPGVFRSGDMLLTKSLAPGMKVYGERLFSQEGEEYREWVPDRSKLSAYLRRGGSRFPFRPDSHVLYLGASSGTTPSHVSDIVPQGRVYCVEISPRMFRDLVGVCEHRPNMMPILGDATKLDDLAFLVERADVVYQDVAQRNQAGIFAKAMKRFSAPYGMLAVKARSEDVAREPMMIFHEAEVLLRKEGLTVLEIIDLEPFEKDHAMIVAGRP